VLPPLLHAVPAMVQIGGAAAVGSRFDSFPAATPRGGGGSRRGGQPAQQQTYVPMATQRGLHGAAPALPPPPSFPPGRQQPAAAPLSFWHPSSPLDAGRGSGGDVTWRPPRQWSPGAQQTWAPGAVERPLPHMPPAAELARAGLPPAAAAELPRAVRLFAAGFHQAVEAALRALPPGAPGVVARRQLLPSIWSAFQAAWEEERRTVFPEEASAWSGGAGGGGAPAARR